MSGYHTYIGTYTDGESDGIYHCRMDETAGTLSEPEPCAATENPSFLAVHPDGDLLFAVNEVAEGRVTAFEISEGGNLWEIDEQVIGPADPCHCTVDKTGQYLFVSHYSGGVVSMLQIDDDGTFGEPSLQEHNGSSVDPERQASPHPHSATVGPANETLYVPDLGTDEVVIYDIEHDEDAFTPVGAVDVHEGAGPRHLAFGPDGARCFVINELDSTLSAFERNSTTGGLAHLETVDTHEPAVSVENYTADVHVHPSGNTVYGSNRGHDTIAVFDDTGDRLTLVETVSSRGSWPRNFVLSPTGNILFAANEKSDTIAAMTVDVDTGHLRPTGHLVEVPQPVCIAPVVG